MKKLLVILNLFTLVGLYSAENLMTAVTPQGKTVLLNSDGTWTYKEQTTTEEGAFDIRHFRWGMTREEVEKTETAEWQEQLLDANTLAMFTEVDFMSEESLLCCYFNMNRLFKVRYIITENHSNRTDYWLNYCSFNRAISKKYGDPVIDSDGSPYWKNDLYRDDPSEWGIAIATGDMVAVAEWETDRTGISTLIQGDNYSIDTWIEFKARDFELVEAEKIDEF